MGKLISVQIETKEGINVVSSRVVAEQLEKRHDNVVRDLEKILETSNVSSLIIPSTYKVDGQKREYKEYLLTKDGFTLYMFNIQGYNDFKMAYINAFNEMERTLREKQPKLPTTYKEALKQLLVQVEENERLQLENTAMKPKAEYHDKVLDTESCYTTTQIAKELEMSGRQLNILLKNMGVQYKQSGQWLLTKEYQDKGYVKTRTHIIDHEMTKHTTVWTEKGREFLIDLAEDF